MKIERVNFVYFSPNGTVRRAVEKMAECAGLPARLYDLTPFNNRWQELEFAGDELVVFAVPTYYGRVPIVRELFANKTGDNTPCAVFCLFGNRAFDDSLLELSKEAEERGFKTAAAAAFLGQHSLIPKLAANRPSGEDFDKLAEFINAVLEKLAAADDITEVKPPQISGHFPYKEQPLDLPVAPLPGEGCTECGLCANVCPMAVINPEDVNDTDKLRCILCHRCVNSCPIKCRKLDFPQNDRKLSRIELLNLKPKRETVFL